MDGSKLLEMTFSAGFVWENSIFLFVETWSKSKYLHNGKWLLMVFGGNDKNIIDLWIRGVRMYHAMPWCYIKNGGISMEYSISWFY